MSTLRALGLTTAPVAPIANASQPRASLALFGLVALLLLVGCDGRTSFSVDHSGGGKIESVTSLPLIEAMHSATFSVGYSGVRRVEHHVDVDGVPTTTIRREQVFADGQGSFSVELVEIVEPVVTPSEFQITQLLQSARAGFLYRDRDFRIRELDLFLQNYGLVVMPGSVTVAGVECLEVRVERLQDAERRYVLAVESNTGLVLRSREEFLSGELISLVEFESLTLAPDLHGVEFHVDNPESPLDLGNPERSGIDYPVQTPGFLPAGFQLRETQTAEDASDGSLWVKLTFGDGVEQVFFLHGGPPPANHAGNVNAHVQEFGQDVVRVLQVGPWYVAQGELRSQRVIAMGKRPEHELLLMLESAVY